MTFALDLSQLHVHAAPLRGFRRPSRRRVAKWKPRRQRQAPPARLLLWIVALLLSPSICAISIDHVPLFTFRCRRLPLPTGVLLPQCSTFYVGQQYYGTANAVRSNGSSWSELGNFTAMNRAKAASTYENSIMASSFFMTTMLAVYPVSNVSNVTCELNFTGTDASSGQAGSIAVAGRLYPGTCPTCGRHFVQC